MLAARPGSHPMVCGYDEMTTGKQAYTELYAPLQALWAGDVIYYPNVTQKGKPDVKKRYARIVATGLQGGQASLANVEGKTRQASAGLLTLELHFPLGTGVGDAFDAVDAVKAAYATSRGGVWFRNVRHQEIGANDTFQVNVYADYNYDAII